MDLERLERKDKRLIVVCAVVALVSLYVGVRYFFFAFPEASIEFHVTKESSLPIATSFLADMELDPAGYRHAAIFDFDNQAKTFLERELGVAESNKVLDTTVRLWRWRHRWFRPLQKEEMQVDVTTAGEPVGFRHLLSENAEGASLSSEEARGVAERFLVRPMGRALSDLTFVEASLEKRPHRVDHTFTWKLAGFETKGADYRLVVGVAGDHVSSYSEYLRVPDTWIRDYQKLRSRNEITGNVDGVFLLLTVLAMLVLLVRRIRRGDVRLKAASTLGTITFVLLSVSQINSIPSALFYYDTTTSFPGFVLQTVLLALLSGFGGAVAIVLISAAAEPLYRERFPRFLSLTSILKLRVFGTKEFFIASLVGITLTFFFFAYENVFYIIANSLGAWAPRDVAYSDLLSTSFPWVYVLFFGWLPAISEEFISRMFSIPLFEKLFRSTAFAVVVSAFIWGFGHASYPNQPFWIRGLEVGLAGIVFGIVLMRFGIIAVVICHFSVDALYTAFVLIRSPNLYYSASGALSAGIFGVLFLVSAVAYVRRGGFSPPEVTNEREGTAPPPEPGTVPETPVAIPVYRRLDRRRVVAGVVLAGALIAIGLLPIGGFGDWIDFRTTRSQARDIARSALHEAGFDVSSYRSAILPDDVTNATTAAYLLEKGGLDVARAVYQGRVPTPVWRLRFFVPGQHEEYSASVDAARGDDIELLRTLPQDAPGETLSKEEAQSLAESFLSARGVDPRKGEMKEQSANDEKARRDHTLVWEYPVDGAPEARVRHTVVVQGGSVGQWSRSVKIPEEWRREREKTTVLTEIVRWSKYPLMLVLASFAAIVFVGKIRAGEMRWRLGFVLGALVALATLARAGLSLDNFWGRYDTSIPFGGFLIFIAVSLFISLVLFFFVGTALGGVVGALYPAASSVLGRESRRLFARDALIAGFLALGLLLALPNLDRIVETLVPDGALITGVDFPTSVSTTVPFLYGISGILLAVVFFSCAGAILVTLFERFFRGTWVRVVFGVLFVIGFLPVQARKPAEYLAAATGLVFLVLGVVLLTKFFLRDNLLAWVWSPFFAFGTRLGMSLLEQTAPALRLHGALVLILVLAPAAWLVRDALQPPSEQGAMP